MASRLFSLLQTCKAVCLSVTESSGRGLVARYPISQHQLLFEEWPIVRAASPAHRHTVCPRCLQPLNKERQHSPDLTAGELRFCGSDCRAADQREQGFVSFETLHDFCSTAGENFPLMAARLAAGYLHTGSEQPLLDIDDLAMARLQRPPPHWVQAHSLMLEGLQSQVHELPAQSQASAKSRMQRLDLDWMVGVLARLHINTIRVDCIFPPKPGQSFADMAEAVLNGSSESYSGSACYLLSSLFNHSCEPNIEMTWPANNSKIAMRAARSIDKGEELTIAYIDASLPLRQRQDRLLFAYGFKCSCTLCEANSAEQDRPQPS